MTAIELLGAPWYQLLAVPLGYLLVLCSDRYYMPRFINEWGGNAGVALFAYGILFTLWDIGVAVVSMVQ